MEDLQQIKQKLSDNHIDEAIVALNAYIHQNPDSEEAHVLRGNAYRRTDNWKMAISDYAAAKSINPEGAGAIAYDQAMEIMSFFNTDLYNP